MSNVNKAIWISGFLCVFLFILATGKTNIQNFQNIHTSLEEIYKDRLVVKGIIYNLSSMIHEKELALASKNSDFFKQANKEVNDKIFNDIRLFKATELTRQEEFTLSRFALGVDQLIRSEESLNLQDGKPITKKQVLIMSAKIDQLQTYLNELSQIQISEGKRKVAISDHAISSMNRFALAEKYILGVFAFLMIGFLFFIPGVRKNNNA